MIQSLSHIQRSTRLSQDFDDYLERTSRSSIHSSSSDIISPQYDYAHQHQAKLQAYQQSQMKREIHEKMKDLMHNAQSGPNQMTQNHMQLQNIQSNKHKPIIAQNKLIGNLNALKQMPFSAAPSDLSDGNTSFMDEMSSDSDLEDEEKMQYNPRQNHPHNNIKEQIHVIKRQYPQLIHQLPKVPKPRNLNLNAHRHKYLRHPSITAAATEQNNNNDNNNNNNNNDPNLYIIHPMHINIGNLNNTNLNRHERADSNSSAMSSSIVSSVCTPHQNDHDAIEDEKAHSFFEKHQISRCSLPNVPKSKMSTVITSSQIDLSAYSMNSVSSVASIHAIGKHINIKIFESSHDLSSLSCELWMNIRPNDTADDVISAVIHQYQNTKLPLKGTQAQHYQLRYYDEDEEEIDEDFPALGRHECVASKQIDSIAMLFIDSVANNNNDDKEHHQNENDEIPDIDWEYKEYQVKDEYSKTKTKCILGIGRDRIHIVIKSHRTKFNTYTDKITNTETLNANNSYINLMRRRISTNGSISGSLMPHFTYVFRLPNRKKTNINNLYHHRWIDARVMMRQKNCRITLHQTEEEKQKEVIRERHNAIYTTTATTNGANNSRDRSIATTFHTAIPKLGLMLQTSIPTNGVLQNMQQLHLRPLRSGLMLDEYSPAPKAPKVPKVKPQKKKNRRTSSAWSFNLNLFGLLNKRKEKEKEKKDAVNIGSTKLRNHAYSTSTVCTDDTDVINYESWNTYNKDGRYFDKQDKVSPPLRGRYRSGSGSVASFLSSRNRNSSVASNLSINNDEFTPLTIELCQKISVLKRDNKVFEINFLLDLSSQTPSSNHRHSHSNSLMNMNHTRTPSKTYWGPRSKRKSKLISAAAVDDLHEFSQQSSTRSLSIQSANGMDKKTHFQPYQADNIEIWTDISQSQSHSQSTSHSHSHTHSQSPSRSSTMELIDVGDYKPTDYKKHWNPTQIIPKLEQISASQHNNNSNNNSPPHNPKNAGHKSNIHHPNSLVKQLVNKAKFHVFGNDKYLTHTVRYSAKSPEDCCQIVRKIQHLMLLENKAMDT